MKENYEFKLMFDKADIRKYASEYSYSRFENEVLESIEIVRHRGHLTKEELLLVANWKTPRSQPRVTSNNSDFVEEVTKIAFTTTNERLRIEILTLLTGVGWPTASVLLHFYGKEKYPIIDFRALYSLDCAHIKQQDYNFKFWYDYTTYTRGLSLEAKVDMRTLDRALWQYSKVNQIA